MECALELVKLWPVQTAQKSAVRKGGWKYKISSTQLWLKNICKYTSLILILEKDRVKVLQESSTLIFTYTIHPFGGKTIRFM